VPRAPDDDVSSRPTRPRSNAAYPGILGYRGPPLSEAAAAAVIEGMMARKSASEIALCDLESLTIHA
jgi:hypothetical protein